MTPLHVAAKFASKEVIELLIDKKADIDAQSESGQSALHFAISQQEKENFQLLILKGRCQFKDSGWRQPLACCNLDRQQRNHRKTYF